jgi:IS5 family transposase
LLKRRSAIEPVIGHGKVDHALGRNYLLGQAGDRLNALLVGCGFNLRKLLLSDNADGLFPAFGDFTA